MCRMTPLWTSADVAAATGGTASAPFAATGVAFDSREVGPGDLFIALTGETTDGHRFLDGAFKKGAAGAIVSSPCNFPHILVEHTTEALNALGVAARWRTTAKAVGVTGSVGKTGTKEALAAALARANRGPVHRSVKSYNNHTGVPLSLARMPADSAYGVFEMGMNHAGELAALTQLVRPNVALITAIAAVHIEFFESVERIADAKAEIFQALEPGGTAIIPFDSPYRDRLIGHAQSCASHIVTFGRGDGADVRAVDVIAVEAGTMLTVALRGAELCFTLSQIAGRGQQHKIAIGNGDALVIDESYNANPTSMAATLAVFATTSATRKIAVLGAMGELGRDSDALHAGLADPVIAAGVDFALLVGSGIEPLAKSLEGRVNFAHVADAATAQVMLSKMIQPGDAILIKGSNAIGLSQIVVALTSGLS
jgi:UDP-N-acetylmuramoyl-tripeptide--D-alanyl-D-alanine ligase